MPPLEAIVEQLDVPALCMPNELQRMLVVVFPIGPALRPSFTLMASARHDLFCPYELTHEHAVTGELSVNPLYRVERRGGSSILTLTFPNQRAGRVLLVTWARTGPAEPLALKTRYR